MSPSWERPPARPSLSFRVGTTGTRSLRSDQIDRIRADVENALALVATKLKLESEREEVTRSYTRPGGKDPAIKLHMISPLAKGADRLVAKAALEAGYELYVPMPFSKEDYYFDFTGRSADNPDEVPLTAEEDRRQFDSLFNAATGSFALDGEQQSGSNDHMAARSYEYVGRFVIRHSDLLIAVWDGEPSRGRGGTGDIVRYAANAGIPIWWIHATQQVPPRWIMDIQDLFEDPTDLLDAAEEIGPYLSKLISPPKRVHRHTHHNLIADIVSWFREPQVQPAEEYFNEKPLPVRWIWNSYSLMMRPPSRSKAASQEARRPEDAIGQYWFDKYQSTDMLASQYAARYRSSYVLVILLTMIALVFGAMAVGLTVLSAERRTSDTRATSERLDRQTQGSETRTAAWAGSHMEQIGTAMALAELAALVVAMLIVGAAYRCDWHERSIEYRLLAELFRKQQTLAELGWALSIGNIEQQVAETERLYWISWLFAAAKRAAPLPQGGPASQETRLANRVVLETLIDEQLDYHRGREAATSRVAATFESLGSVAFIILLGCVLVKVALELFPGIWLWRTHFESDGVVLLLGLGGLVLPGISAAFVGVRSYAELQLLAEQSRHMIGELTRFRKVVGHLKLNHALVSQDLGTEAVAVATLMLQDLEGWGRLFRGKSMES